MADFDSGPMRLLIAATRDALAGSSTSATVRLEDADWRELPGLANRHGTTAWLHDALSLRTDVPSDVRESVASDVRILAADSLRATRELLDIVKALERDGIPVLAIKGPALTWWLYGAAARRRFTDLDVVVSPARSKDALTTLCRLGYRLPPGATRASSSVVYAGRSAWPLTRAGSFPVDLHWRFADVSFAAPLPVARAFEQASSIEIADGRLPIPSATHIAVVMFAHAAKHGWCALEILATLGHVLQRRDVKWTDVARLYAEAGTMRALIAGAQLVEETFAVKVPPELRDRRPPEASPQLLSLARTALELPAGVHLNRWQERQLHRASMDRPLQRLRYEALRLMMPTPLDAAWCRLPDSLAVFYSPLRLLRLALQTASGGLHGVRDSESTLRVRRRRAFPR